MVIDVAKNPRIAQLLGRLEEARRLVREHPAGHPARVALDERIDGFYAEVGRYVHWLVRQDPSALTRLAEEGRRWAERLDEELGIQVLPTISGEEVLFEDVRDDESYDATGVTNTGVELTGDSRAAAVDVRELVELEPLAPGDDSGSGPDEERTDPRVRPAARPAPSRDAVPELAEDALFALEEDTSPSDVSGAETALHVAVRTGAFEIPAEPGEGTGATSQAARRRAEVDDTDWLSRLRLLLDVLGPPRTVPTEDEGRELLLRTLSQATTNLEVSWSVFPEAVQQALLGLVGARARRLEEEVETDADVRLALGRMRRFAEHRGLLLVPALRDTTGPARNWTVDERRYWAVLHAGM